MKKDVKDYLDFYFINSWGMKENPEDNIPKKEDAQGNDSPKAEE